MKRQIIAAVDDMFFAAKIRATAEHIGQDVIFARNADAVRKAAHENTPALIIVDLQSRQLEPLALAQSLKADEPLRMVPLLGFYSHVQTALKQQAEQAGFDHLMTRSAFTKNLPEILQLNI